MTEPQAEPQHATDEPVVPEETEAEEPIAEAPDEESAATPSADEEEMDADRAKAEAEIGELKDKILRMNAEMDNVRKRMAKENADRLKYNHMDFIRELLPGIDSLERALEHAQQQEETPSEAMLEGIQMVHKMLTEAMSKFGVTRIEAKGELFDPHCHQAVGMVQTDEVPENHVLDVYQVGYYLHDRVVRPAMVRVAEKS
jgi:molecular chaperone GrpE